MAYLNCTLAVSSNQHIGLLGRKTKQNKNKSFRNIDFLKGR